MENEHEEQLRESRKYWDYLASSFDHEPDHGLQDTFVRETWSEFLRSWLPVGKASILDAGCGTGSLSVVLATLGHDVTGIDISQAMIELAQEKSERHGLKISFQVMDAAFPKISRCQFDVVLCRHILWTLPEPELVLQRWVELLRPMGRFILIEGYWETGSGYHSGEIITMLPTSFTNVTVVNLSDNPGFWGASVADERFAIIAVL